MNEFKIKRIKCGRGTLYIRVDRSLYFERQIIHESIMEYKEGNTRGMLLYFEKGF